MDVVVGQQPLSQPNCKHLKPAMAGSTMERTLNYTCYWDRCAEGGQEIGASEGDGSAWILAVVPTSLQTAGSRSRGIRSGKRILFGGKELS